MIYVEVRIKYHYTFEEFLPSGDNNPGLPMMKKFRRATWVGLTKQQMCVFNLVLKKSFQKDQKDAQKRFYKSQYVV